MKVEHMRTFQQADECTNMVKHWLHKSDTYSGIEFVDRQFDVVAGRILDTEDYVGVLLIDDEGHVAACLLGMLVPYWFNNDCYAQDIVMCKRPDAMPTQSQIDEMVDAFVSWAWSKNAKRVVFGDTMQVNPRAVEQIYVRAGAEARGTIYVLER